MTTPDTEALRRVAEAAVKSYRDDAPDKAAAIDFDVTFDPPTVLALLDERDTAANRISELEARVGAIREAFLNLRADADRWDEDVDGDVDSEGRTVVSIHYHITTGHSQLAELADAMGIARAHDETAGDAITRAAQPTCVNHPARASRTNLDGDDLCQECADIWVRGEGQAAFDADQEEAALTPQEKDQGRG